MTAPKLTDETIQTLKRMMLAGCTDLAAAAAAGIHPNTFYSWRKRAEAEEEPYCTALKDMPKWRAERLAVIEQAYLAKSLEHESPQHLFRLMKAFNPADYEEVQKVEAKLTKGPDLSKATDEELEVLRGILKKVESD